MSVAPPRWARLVLTVQAALLVLAGAVGLALGAARGGGEVPVLFLRPNPLHSALLLVTGVLGLVAAQRLRPLMWFCAVQFAVYLVLFYANAGQSGAGEDRDSALLLDGPENLVHVALVVIAFSVGLGTAALTRPARSRAARSR